MSHGLRVLLVDDLPMTHRRVHNMLAPLGVELISCRSGRSALNMRGDFDLVIIEAHLSDMDGVEVARALRMEQPDLAVIGLSAIFGDVGRFRAMGGAAACLVKPYDGALLRSTVHTLVGLRPSTAWTPIPMAV